MTKPLDFNKIKKQYLTVTLADEVGTVLQIGTPTKAITDELLALNDELTGEVNNMENTEMIESLFGACATVMSRNKTGKVITKEYLEEIFDFEDVMIFFNAYMSFVGELTNSKN